MDSKKLVETEILIWHIKKSGYTKKHIADYLGVTYATLHSKITGKHAFTVPEMIKISKLLNLTSADQRIIFLT